MIVILNGTSSAGKTTTAKALQELMSRPILLLGIDTFVYALPPRYLSDPSRWAEVFHYEYSDDRIVRITPGSFGDRLVRGLHGAVGAAAAQGLDVVVDHVLLDRAWVRDLEEQVDGHDVVRVGVTCPLEVLEGREQARRDRTLGQARAQVEVVHRFMTYDVVVDTSTMSPQECALRIADQLRALRLH